MKNNSAFWRIVQVVGFAPMLTMTACSLHTAGNQQMAPRLNPSTQLNLAGVPLSTRLVHPMYRRLLPINLSAVIRIAEANNVDVKKARQEVRLMHGHYASAIGAALPVLAPAAIFDFNQGAARATQGQLVTADFTALTPAAAVQWIINPGQVIYNIVAAKKRCTAAKAVARGSLEHTLSRAADKYYALILDQVGIAVAFRERREAEELVAAAKLRLQTGAGIPVDVDRAEAAFSAARESLLSSLHQFNHDSVSLAMMLQINPDITLVPNKKTLEPIVLIRGNIPVGTLMRVAIAWRPVLKQVRDLAAAAGAAKSAAIWGDLGPAATAGYQAGGMASRSAGQADGLRPFQDGSIGAGWQLGFSTFGDIESADAAKKIAILNARQALERVQSQVVNAMQDRDLAEKSVPIARQELTASERAYKRLKTMYMAGAANQLEVLQSQGLLVDARLFYARAITHYEQSQINLLTAVGLIDAHTLEPLWREDMAARSDSK
ncbi:MAG: TolC family protein [Phycisphaerae bacterium]